MEWEPQGDEEGRGGRSRDEAGGGLVGFGTRGMVGLHTVVQNGSYVDTFSFSCGGLYSVCVYCLKRVLHFDCKFIIFLWDC